MDDVREIIVDTDTGVDDAMALIYLARDPAARIAAVTAVYGNCHVEDALRNAAHVLDLAGAGDVPFSRGAAGPLHGQAHIAGYVHGADGLGDLPGERPLPPLTDRSAAEQLVHLARTDPGRYHLLALGPLTNVALALAIDPDVLTRFASVVLMGGSGPFQAPGRSLMVDANVQNDPAAAAAVYAAPRTEMVMVGVDVTGPTILDEASIADITGADTPWAPLAATALGFYADFYAQEFGRAVFPLHDELAAAVVAHPELVTATVAGPAAIIDTGYQTRGRILVTVDGRAPHVRLAPGVGAAAGAAAGVADEPERLPVTTAVAGIDEAAFRALLHTALVTPPDR